MAETKPARKKGKDGRRSHPKLSNTVGPETDKRDVGLSPVTVADQIRAATRPKDDPPVEPNLEPDSNPVSASAPRPSWKQREQERLDRREELRLAQLEERRRIEELAAVERAEVRKAQERQREREMTERREQQRLVEQIQLQRRQELQLAVQVRREQQREAHFQSLQQIVDGLVHATNPPPPAEQPDMPPSEEGTGRLGHADFNPALMSQPLRWW
jgi:hypothetical protein